ncbi:general secretion pathway protein E [Rheinheimera pacifica]|uniref:GspE/PulE family protein n=1 Tax=Rheinheimera pacifica TaxID=173990 RepID=UPI002167A379|nr:ATPase, T2SS/T4P/T4SS family [Rheinheimera pacifica]MCS4309511.1 general secretion pathway protein E [Rheinheimera pacifica]
MNTGKVVSDKQLRVLYFDDRNTIVLDSGVILTSNYQSTKHKEITDYVFGNPTLCHGKFLGKRLPVSKVNPDVISSYLATDELKDSQLRDTSKLNGDSQIAIRLKELQQNAANWGSSDIHIELYENLVKIYARVDGRRVKLKADIPDYVWGDELFSYIFNIAAVEKDEDYDQQTPNNGKLEADLVIDKITRKTIWRASYIPAKGGGKITLRWLNKEKKIPKLDELGYSAGQVRVLRDFLKKPSGAALFTGKTGSGKTTGIASLLSEVSDEKAMHTLEDPTEFDLGIPQTHVKPGKKDKEGRELNFQYYSKVLLRHDTDGELHGEIRDNAGAMEVARKAETGQLILASLHTSSAIGVAHTFIEQFNVSPAVVAAPELMCLWVYQTLVRKLCNNCKMTEAQAEAHYSDLGQMEVFTHIKNQAKTLCEQTDDVRYRNPVGCDHCFEGERHRTAVAEIIVLDDEDRNFILHSHKNGHQDWLTALRKKGFRDVRDHAIAKIKRGEIDVITASARVNSLFPVKTEDIYKTFNDVEEG